MIPMADKDPKTLRSAGDWTVRLMPEIMGEILGEAFRSSLIALEEEIKQIAVLKSDFVILLCGASFGNLGFRKEAEQVIEIAEKRTVI